MKIFILVILTLSLLFFVNSVEAKVLPQAKKSAIKQTAVKGVNTSSISVSPRIRADRKALIINFSNLQNAQSVSYFLSYLTNGQQEGARGDLNLTGLSNTSNELLFGTCSKNICRYHTNIKDTRLEVSYALKNGKRYLKKYRIKI